MNVSSRLAVLIDGENFPSGSAAPLLSLIKNKLGAPAICRVFGDFSNAAHAGWLKAAKTHAIALQLSVPVAKRKNAADIALTIAAMDILHCCEGEVERFCLVTSDGDFTPLAIRIREAGRLVYGVDLDGKAPNAYRKALREFYSVNAEKGEAKSAPERRTSSPKPAIKSKKPDAKTVQAIVQITNEAINANGASPVKLGQLGKYLRMRISDYGARVPKSQTLGATLLQTGQFDLSSEGAVTKKDK